MGWGHRLEGTLPEGFGEGAVVAALAAEVLKDLEQSLLANAVVAVQVGVMVASEQAVGGLAYRGIDLFRPDERSDVLRVCAIGGCQG